MKTVIFTDSKAALQSLTSNTSDQQISPTAEIPAASPPMNTPWILAHCGIPGNERADHLAKSGSKQLQPMSTSTYQEAKTLLRNRQKCQWKSFIEPLETTTPLLSQSSVWQDMSRPLYSGCKQDTVACEHT